VECIDTELADISGWRRRPHGSWADNGAIMHQTRGSLDFKLLFASARGKMSPPWSATIIADVRKLATRHDQLTNRFDRASGTRAAETFRRRSTLWQSFEGTAGSDRRHPDENYHRAGYRKMRFTDETGAVGLAHQRGQRGPVCQGGSSVLCADECHTRQGGGGAHCDDAGFRRQINPWAAARQAGVSDIYRIGGSRRLRRWPRRNHRRWTRS
jgi:hypothetical protein